MNTPKLPPLPHWCEEGSPFAQQMQAYALAAIEALRAQIGQHEPLACAQVVSMNDVQGVVEWLPHHGKPIKVGESLYSAPQQIGQCDMQIRVLFECVENGVTGTTSVPVKRVEWEDDGTLTAVLDYWPPQAPQAKPPLTDEQSRELAEQHYVCSPWYDTNPASVIGSRQWCAYWDGWRAAVGIKGE